MQTNRSEEREIFLKHLKDIYLQNPDLPISSETIYMELLKLAVIDGKKTEINFDGLVGVQVVLNNKYRNNTIVNTFTSSDGNFWAIENRMGKSDIEYLTDMYNGIKLYVPVQIDNLCKVAENLFNFMIKENIVMQCKISKEMRTDALVCRVRTKDDAIKISNYLDSLSYKSNVRPNPFLYDNGNVCMAIDGTLSYNSIISRLLEQYLYTKRMTDTLDKVNSNDFNNFVKSQIEFLNSNQKKEFMDLYQINGEDQYKDFVKIAKLLSENLEGSLTEEKLFSYQEHDYVRIGRSKENYFEQDDAKILYVINTLATYYSIDYVHKIIMGFIQTGKYNLFTRKIGEVGGVRAIIENNFSSNDVKRIISELGWKSLISASKVTYDKYGEEQLFAAIKNVFNGEGILEFTNDYEVRSRLGLVVPLELLKEVIVSKLNANDMNINVISFMNLVLDEINKLEEKKINGRK